MQTSSNKKKNKAINRLLKIAFFIALFAMINNLFTFVITPFCTSSTQMWDYYRAKADERLDMVYVGTSACYEGIDPTIVDEETGLTSYNMGSNSQTYFCTYDALAAAIREHHISQAVMSFDEYYLIDGQQHNAKSEAAFSRAQNRGAPITEYFPRMFSYMFNKEYAGTSFSVNYLFPWLVDRTVLSNKVLEDEFKVKLGLKQPVISDTNNLRESDCFKPFHYTIDYDKLSVRSSSWNASKVSDEAVDEIRKIIELCQDNDVKLTFIVPPYPTATILGQGSGYMSRIMYIKKILADYDGVNYYDFNMARSELYEHNSDYFKDETHMNVEGATAFSRSLGKLLSMTADGSNANSLFYWDWDSYLASVDWIDNVELSWEAYYGSCVKLKAYARTGSAVEVKYLFQYYDYDNEEYVTFREYDSSNKATFYPETSGKYRFRVIAKKSNGDDGIRRKKALNVNYFSK